MSRPSFPLVAVLALLAGAAGLLAAWLPQRGEIRASTANAAELAPGSPVERGLWSAAGGSHLVRLQPGDYLHAVVEQRGVDVVASLHDPAGRKLLEVDSPNGRTGPETLLAVARSPGLHRLEVRPLDGRSTGRYGVRIVELRPATGRDRLVLQRWQRRRQARDEALAWRRTGQASFAAGNLRDAHRAFETALALGRRLGDRAMEGTVLVDIGAVYRTQSEPGKAEDAFLAARRLCRAQADRRCEAAALSGLGGLYASRADLRSALDAYSGALAAWRALEDRAWEAATLHDIGRTYSLMGRNPEALAFLRRTLGLRQAAGDRRGEAAALTEIGWVHFLSGDAAGALRFYDRSIALSRQGGNLLGEAAALDRRGTALARSGRLEESLASYGRALAIFQRAGRTGSVAHTLANLGWLHEARGDPRTAVRCEEQALRLFRRSGDRHAEAHTLLGLARAERRRGNLFLARSHAEAALALAESLRGEAPVQALRTSYLATRHEYYEFAVDLLMEMGLPEPAWEIAERARARSLLESVAAGPGAPAIDEDLRRLVLAKGEIRAPAAVAPPASLDEVRRQVLDADTRLLQYALGEERSFLWVIGPASIDSYALPGRRRIEDLARRAHSLLARSHKGTVEEPARLAAAALSDAILAPAAARFEEGKRLLIVADGALQYVPFAALPVASSGGVPAPLLADHEVVSAPSASVLARLRRERARRPPAPRLLAVIADPAFEAGVELARLPWSRREAETILGLVPPSEGLRALGFAASRDLVLSGRLAQYRILHFATHGLLDAEHPDRSGLVLSRVDERGRRRQGFLSVAEIPALDLRADLVVLSACRTALGREVRGEGLLGMTQAFLQAGASRVVVSLWNANDAAAAELMSRFYRAMLRDELPPSAALRRAQLSMLREPRRQAPYYWAGFLLQGEWR